MRKFTKYLMVLAAAAFTSTTTALAQNKLTDLSDLENTTKCYTMVAARGYVGVSTNQATVYGFTGTPDASVDNNRFFIAKQGDVYYFYNIGQKKFVSNSQTAPSSMSQWSLQLIDAPDGGFTAVATGNADYPWHFTVGSKHLNMGGSKQIVVDNWSAYDAGNQFYFEEAGDIDADLKATVMKLVDPNYITAQTNYNIVCGTPETAINYDAASAAAVKTAFETEDYEAANTAYETFKTFGSNTVATGTYYRVKNCARNLSIDNDTHFGQGAYMSVNPALNNVVNVLANNNQPNDASALWQFVDAGDGNYKIYNVNADKYMGKSNPSANSQFFTLTDEAEAGIFAISHEGPIFKMACTNAGGAASIGTELHVSAYGVMNWNTSEYANASGWYIVPATSLEVALTQVGDAYWATTYLPYDVASIEGAEAYKATTKGETSIKIETVSDIKANQGVVLKGTAAKATLTLGTATADFANNALKGTNTTMDVTANASDFLVLSTADGEIGFYGLPATATTLKANRAYLENTGAAALSLDFGTATGIADAINAAQLNTNAPAYDLSGRRVMKPTNGVFIQNGKKFVIK